MELTRLFEARQRGADRARAKRDSAPIRNTTTVTRLSNLDVTRKPKVFDAKGVMRETNVQRSSIVDNKTREHLDDSVRPSLYPAIKYDRETKRWVSNSYEVTQPSNSDPFAKLVRRVTHDARQEVSSSARFNR